MALDTTQLLPALLGVPDDLVDLPFANGGIYLFADTVNGPAYGIDNVRTRFLRETARFRLAGGTSQARSIAFGVDRSGGSTTAACPLAAVALAYTNIPRLASLRLRRVGPVAYNDTTDLWIDQPCAAFGVGAPLGTINVAARSRLDLTTAMTLSAWIYPTTVDATARRIFGWASSGATRYPYQLSILNTGSGTFLRFTYTHSSGTAATVNSSVSAALGTNKWQQVGFTISGTTLTFIVNGASIGTATLAASTRDAGNGAPELGGASPNSFLGRMSDVRIYNAAVDYVAYAKTALWKGYAHPDEPYWSNLVGWLPLATGGDPTVHYGQAPADRAGADANSMTATFATTTGGVRRQSSGTVADTGLVDAFDQSALGEPAFCARRRDCYLVPEVNFGISDTASPFNLIYSYQLDIVPNDFGEQASELLEIGRLIAGDAVQLGTNVVDPWAIGVEDPSIVELTDYGQLWCEERDTYRTSRVSQDLMSSEEAMALLELVRSKGQTSGLFYIADPRGPALGIHQSMYARISGRVSLEQSEAGWSVTIPLEELRVG